MTAPIIDPAQPTPPAPAAPAPVPTLPPSAPPAPAPAAFDPSQLAPEAQEYLRQQVAAADAKARLTSKANAAKEAEKALSERIAAALGLAPETAADPAALTAQLTSAQQRARQLEVEREVSRAARKHGADEDLLVAVLAHRGKIATLDPSVDGFAEALDALVKSEVDANPRLRAGGTHTPPAPGAQGATGTGFAAGTGADPQITDEQLKAAYASGNSKQIDEWMRAGKLSHLL